ncbi:hypothetical protein B7463_g9325, partial [Scytalidium lignicola]
MVAAKNGTERRVAEVAAAEPWLLRGAALGAWSLCVRRRVAGQHDAMRCRTSNNTLMGRRRRGQYSRETWGSGWLVQQQQRGNKLQGQRFQAGGVQLLGGSHWTMGRGVRPDGVQVEEEDEREGREIWHRGRKRRGANVRPRKSRRTPRSPRSRPRSPSVYYYGIAVKQKSWIRSQEAAKNQAEAAEATSRRDGVWIVAIGPASGSEGRDDGQRWGGLLSLLLCAASAGAGGKAPPALPR